MWLQEKVSVRTVSNNLKICMEHEMKVYRNKQLSPQPWPCLGTFWWISLLPWRSSVRILCTGRFDRESQCSEQSAGQPAHWSHCRAGNCSWRCAAWWPPPGSGTRVRAGAQGNGQKAARAEYNARKRVYQSTQKEAFKPTKSPFSSLASVLPSFSIMINTREGKQITRLQLNELHRKPQHPDQETKCLTTQINSFWFLQPQIPFAHCWASRTLSCLVSFAQ